MNTGDLKVVFLPGDPSHLRVDHVPSGLVAIVPMLSAGCSRQAFNRAMADLEARHDFISDCGLLLRVIDQSDSSAIDVDPVIREVLELADQARLGAVTAVLLEKLLRLEHRLQDWA